jgi:hypothetical protein
LGSSINNAIKVSTWLTATGNEILGDWVTKRRTSQSNSLNLPSPTLPRLVPLPARRQLANGECAGDRGATDGLLNRKPGDRVIVSQCGNSPLRSVVVGQEQHIHGVLAMSAIPIAAESLHCDN